MTSRAINNDQYLVQANDPDDMVYVKVGRQFLNSDSRSIKSIDYSPNPDFKYNCTVTMNNESRYKAGIAARTGNESLPLPVKTKVIKSK